MSKEKNAGKEIEISDAGLKELGEIDREYGLSFISRDITASVSPSSMEEIEQTLSSEYKKNISKSSRLY